MTFSEQPLSDIARELRRDALTLIYEGGDGHPGPALGIADVVATLYFREMNIDPKRPNWPERDRLILSKGHACPIVYASLEKLGYLEGFENKKLRALGSVFQGHPDMNKTPGIDSTSGSLGNGLSVGIGMAMAAKYQKLDYTTYVITGDGELQEGIIWEGIMTASHYKLGNLIMFVDHNGLQSGFSVAETTALMPIAPKFEVFDWHAQEIDGHDYGQIQAAIAAAKEEADRPSVIVARTTKGKGVPFMENDNSWHKGVPTDSQFREAMQVLGGAAS